ncbi:hypothetical protein DQ244_11545 [Blastococcus sp. TBT05-19]|uniref:DUF881 domain-containing protein n=1 Tax=Blastococcus sp. TBT05-19 TaxID=2250581 RepID=UPI000DEA2621|nr:DUF881 domain-containing protein [Blastococcus sp. TBT05-19]RBY90105.1 hypothetical protein DQ244_11545 [Blastococcus sp. TBT05-19]
MTEQEAAGPTPPAEPAADEPRQIPAAGRGGGRRRRDLVAAALIGVLTLVLGFALAVQVRNADEAQVLAGAREEDLVRILDELNSREDRLRAQIAEQRTALQELSGSGSRTGTALQEARGQAEALGILNGTLPAQGPGITLTVRDPSAEVRVQDLLDVIQELRGAGAETMQVDGVRIGLSTAVTGTAGGLRVDGTSLSEPYEFLVIGDPQGIETAMNIPGGVVQAIGNRGGSVTIEQSQLLEVDALRPLDRPQYAAPDDGGR